ncbi:MAG: hypothetical protein ABH827_01770 [bacterium]
MIIGSEIYPIQLCSDSMKLAKDHLQVAQSGAVFIVEQLAHAHGRQGRDWLVSDGQLALTILLKPAQDRIRSGGPDGAPVISQELNYLNMALSLGILEPLKKYGVGLKWPNDFFVHDKKVGGMLLESVWSGQSIGLVGVPDLAGVILGFALNINNSFDCSHELFSKAMSLHELAGNSFDIVLLQDDILAELDIWYQKWCAGDFETIFDAWKKNQIYMGKKISVHNTDKSVMNGIFIDLLSNGDLVLKDDHGVMHTISFCSVSALNPVLSSGW